MRKKKTKNAFIALRYWKGCKELLGFFSSEEKAIKAYEKRISSCEYKSNDDLYIIPVKITD